MEEAEESLASVDPDLRVDLSGTGVEIIDPNTYRLVGLTRQSISKFHDIISCDFHNCLDLDRRGTHVNWSDDYPVSPFEAQRFLTNGLVIVCSYCYKQETKQHIIRTTCNTAESLESELGAICVAFVVLTRSPTRRGGKAEVLQRLSAAPPGAGAKWIQPLIHIDDSSEIIDSFASVPKATPIYIRSASSSCSSIFALCLLRSHCGLLRLHP